MKQAFVGVGANLGDRWGTIQTALAALAGTPKVARVDPSAVFETEPVGVVDQPVFLNLVAGVETELSPAQLHAVLQKIEGAAGRKREGERRWGPRTLDLDLLLFEGETCDEPGLTLPHPRLWERAFVTEPLRELLSRSTAYARPAWDRVRERIAKMPQPEGVRRWMPPP